MPSHISTAAANTGLSHFEADETPIHTSTHTPARTPGGFIEEEDEEEVQDEEFGRDIGEYNSAHVDAIVCRMLGNIGYTGLCDREVDVALFARTLLDSGEFQRCAHLLRKSEIMPTQLIEEEDGNKSRGGSPLFIYFSCYALYMAGQRLKQQNTMELKQEVVGESLSSVDKKARNPFLTDVFKILYPLWLSDSQTRGPLQSVMDGFLLYIFGVVVRDMRCQGIGGVGHGTGVPVQLANVPPAIVILTESVHRYPWNWSCWLEIGEICTRESLPAPTWAPSLTYSSDDPASDHPSGGIGIGITDSPERSQKLYLDTESVRTLRTPEARAEHLMATQGALMHSLFLVHFHLELHQGDVALDNLSAVDRVLPNSLQVLASSAMAHYSLRDLDSAQDAFEMIRERDPHRLEHVDTYSNILYVKERRADLSHLAHMMGKVNKYAPETCCVIGNYYSLKGHHEKAVTYFRRALRLNSKFLSAWTLMGHEYVEMRNTSAAVRCYREAIDVSDTDYRAWYGLGQTYEMLHLYQYAVYYFKRATVLRPTDPRMWCAVGNCLCRLGSITDAISAYERAAGSSDKEGIAVKELGRLYRQQGNHEKAAEYFQRLLLSAGIIVTATGVVRSDSSSSGAATDDASMVDKTAACLDASVHEGVTLEGVGVAIDDDRADACLYLANYHKLRGKDGARTAAAYCGLLLEYSGPECEEAKAILREIKSGVLSVAEMGGTTVGGIDVYGDDGGGRGGLGNGYGNGTGFGTHAHEHQQQLYDSRDSGDMDYEEEEGDSDRMAGVLDSSGEM